MTIAESGPVLTFETPLGPVTARETNGRLADITFGGSERQQTSPLLEETRAQIVAYFDGARTEFDLPLAPPHSPFQGKIRAAMMAIPYGETRSYGELATLLKSAARAVGQACGSNPIPIIVPCHRVLAAGGRIGGYSAGTGAETKRWLLAHEAPQNLQNDLFAQAR